MLQMHDALDTSVTSREQGELIARLGEEAVKLEVPMRVDVKYGRSWGDAKHTWEELHGTAPAPKQASAPAPKSESSPRPNPNPSRSFRNRSRRPWKQRHAAGRSPCGQEGPAARHAVADDPQNEGGSVGARIHPRPNLQHDSWTGMGAFTEFAIRSSAPTRANAAAAASAAGDHAHPVHQGRRTADQADLARRRWHVDTGQIRLRDVPRHRRARHGRGHRWARRVDRNADRVTGTRARRLCAPICRTRLRSRPRRCCSTARRGRT